MTRGKKETAGKLRWDLLPLGPLEEVVKVYTYGSIKYDDWNWYKGLSYSECFAAMFRHIKKYSWEKEVIDKENHAHHLASVAFYCLCLITFDSEKRPKLDDRIKMYASKVLKNN